MATTTLPHTRKEPIINRFSKLTMIAALALILFTLATAPSAAQPGESYGDGWLYVGYTHPFTGDIYIAGQAKTESQYQAEAVIWTMDADLIEEMHGGRVVSQEAMPPSILALFDDADAGVGFLVQMRTNTINILYISKGRTVYTFLLLGDNYDEQERFIEDVIDNGVKFAKKPSNMVKFDPLEDEHITDRLWN